MTAGAGGTERDRDKKDLVYGPGSFLYAERAGQESLGLSIYAELTEDQQAYVVETIKKFYGRN
jgi:dTDP-4-amino-4,6-dideoxygalactose transaminase